MRQHLWPEEFLAATAARPDSDVAYGITSAFYRRRARWGDALLMSEKQFKLISGDASSTKIANVHYALGLSHEKLGHADKARTEYQAAVAANPANEDARKALASSRQ